MYMILLVLNDPDYLEDILTAWEEAGVSGITVLPSTGLGRIRQHEGLRDDMPLMPALEDFYHHQSDISQTLFTIVDSDELKQKVVVVTEKIIGSLDLPGNGILAVLPTVEVRGLIHRGNDQAES
jgi:nitrogen regulatory protein P-II 1